MGMIRTRGLTIETKQTVQNIEIFLYKNDNNNDNNFIVVASE